MYGTIDRIPPKPRWGSLYALAASMLALLGLVEAIVPPTAWRRMLELGIVVMAFGAIYLWVRANRRELHLAGARDAGFRTIVVTSHAEPGTPTHRPWTLSGLRMRPSPGGRR